MHKLRVSRATSQKQQSGLGIIYFASALRQRVCLQSTPPHQIVAERVITYSSTQKPSCLGPGSTASPQTQLNPQWTELQRSALLWFWTSSPPTNTSKLIDQGFREPLHAGCSSSNHSIVQIKDCEAHCLWALSDRTLPYHARGSV